MARTKGPSCHSKSLEVSISSYNLEKQRVKESVAPQDNTHVASTCPLVKGSFCRKYRSRNRTCVTRCSWSPYADQWKYEDKISNRESNTPPWTKPLSWLLHRATVSSLDERNIITCSGHTLSFGFCLTGRSPPRKSEVSMCKWQLTEYNFWFAKAANTWQIVVFPHLWETHTRLARSMNFKYTSTNTPSSKREEPWGEPHQSHRDCWSTQGLCPLPQRALPPNTSTLPSLSSRRASAAWTLWNRTLSRLYPVSPTSSTGSLNCNALPTSMASRRMPSVHTMWLNLDSKVDIGVDNLPIKGRVHV